MTLVDLTRGLFTHLVRFRQTAGRPDAPSWEKARRDLLSRFEEMGDQVRRQPHLRAPYEMVIHALAALADEVVVDSDWEHAGRWKRETMARRLFGHDEGEDGFFQRLEGLKKPPPDVLAIYYLCLALGFHGRHSPDAPELARLKADLLSRLPSRPSLEQPAPAPAPAEPTPVANAPRRIAPLVAREVTPEPRPREPVPTLSQREVKIRGPWARRLGLAALGLVLLAAAWVWLRPGPPAPGPSAPSAAAKPASPTAAAKPVEPTPAPMAAAPAPVTPAPAEPAPPAPLLAQAQAAPAPAPVPAPAPSPPAAPPAPVTPAVPAAEGDYAVQAGLFVGPLQSGRLAESIRRLGYPASVLEREVGGKPRYVVLAGPFARREEAQAALEPLRGLGIQPYITDPKDPGKRLP